MLEVGVRLASGAWEPDLRSSCASTACRLSAFVPGFTNFSESVFPTPPYKIKASILHFSLFFMALSSLFT